jgi:hypothetical protein
MLKTHSSHAHQDAISQSTTPKDQYFFASPLLLMYPSQMGYFPLPTEHCVIIHSANISRKMGQSKKKIFISIKNITFGRV